MCLPSGRACDALQHVTPASACCEPALRGRARWHAASARSSGSMWCSTYSVPLCRARIHLRTHTPVHVHACVCAGLPGAHGGDGPPLNPTKHHHPRACTTPNIVLPLNCEGGGPGAASARLCQSSNFGHRRASHRGSKAAHLQVRVLRVRDPEGRVGGRGLLCGSRCGYVGEGV